MYMKHYKLTVVCSSLKNVYIFLEKGNYTRKIMNDKKKFGIKRRLKALLN